MAASAGLRNGQDAALAFVLLGIAWAARLALRDSAPYGDEAIHYVMARDLGFLDRSIVWAGTGEPFQPFFFVAGRPLFALAHFPGAQFGFDGFRLLGGFYAALLAPIAYGVARSFGSARWLAAAAGMVVALDPTFVVWGARIFPDSLMAVLVLLAIAAWAVDRPVAGSVLVALACWTKESALAAAGGLAAFAFWSAVSKARSERRSPRAAVPGDRSLRWACGAVLVGSVPMLVSYVAFPRLPGWVMGGDFGPAWEGLWLTSWLALAPLVALAVPRARPLAAVGLGLLAFYLAFHLVRGGFIQAWYAVLPGVVALLCSTVALAAAFRSVRWPRLAATPLACLVTAALVAGIVGTTGPAAALHPLAPSREPGLAASYAFVNAEGPEVAAAWAFQRQEGPQDVLLLDVYWFWVAFPFAGKESTTIAYPLLTEPEDVEVEMLAGLAESSDLVWLQDWNGTFERAFLSTYADCQAFTAGDWVAFKVHPCAGRGGELRAAFEQFEAAAG